MKLGEKEGVQGEGKPFSKGFPSPCKQTYKEKLKMKVVLTQDVKTQGKKGQLIDVSDGYARNFLLPRGLAVIADNKALNEIKGREEAEKHRQAVELQNAKDIAAKLETITLKFRNQVGADGCIYGSVTSKEIADALKGQFGIVVDKRKILLDRPIKNFGKTTVSVKLHSEVTGKVVVDVEEDK